MFADPIAQVIIADGKSGEVWVMTDPNTPWVTSVSLSWTGNNVLEGITINVDIPYEAALKYMEVNSSPFRPGNVLKARIGYATGGWTEWSYGTLSQGGYGLSMSPDGLSGTLNVVSSSVKIGGYTLSKDVLDKSGSTSISLLRKIAEFVSADFRVTDLAQVQLGTWDAADTNASLRELSAIDPVNTDQKSYQKRTDYIGSLAGKDMYAAVVDICRMTNCLYKILIEDGKRVMHVYTEGELYSGSMMADPSKKTKYVIRGIIDVESNQFPCFSFTPDSTFDTATWTSPSAAASGVEATAIDSATGEDVTHTYKPEDRESAGVGVVDVQQPKDVNISLKDFEQIFADIKKTDGRAATYMSAPVLPGGRALFEKQVERFGMSGNPGLQMEINSIGVPWERIDNICVVKGAGELYDDEYCINKIVHNWSPGVWDMTLGVFRQGKKDVAGDQTAIKGGQIK
jgi:hypothetical protein